MAKVWVTKYSGEKEPYDQKKVVGSIVRSGVDKSVVAPILGVVESQLYDGIPTSEIYEIVSRELKKYTGRVTQQPLYHLREALAKLGPFEFEGFISRMLEDQGFTCQTDLIVPGLCVAHQIDVIAQNQQHGFYYVEVKHHRNFHRETDLGTTAEVWARFEDLKKGYSHGRHQYNFVAAWLITNTKFSDHAKKYARCKELKLTGWRFSLNGRYKNIGLEKMISPAIQSILSRRGLV